MFYSRGPQGLTPKNVFVITNDAMMQRELLKCIFCYKQEDEYKHLGQTNSLGWVGKLG